jgi:hypothetical protein
MDITGIRSLGEPLHRGKCAIDIGRRRKAADGRCNNAVRRDETIARFKLGLWAIVSHIGLGAKVRAGYARCEGSRF